MNKSQHPATNRHPTGTLFTHLLLVSVIALLPLLAACDNKAKEAQQRAAAAPPPPVVEFTPVIQRDVPIYDEWVGTLDGMVNAQILAQVTGYLIRQNYREGDFVKKGQMLYEIDPRTFQASLDQARGSLARQQALLTTARLDMERIQRLLPENAVSVRERDNAVGREMQSEAAVATAEAAVETAKLQLGFTKITSPIDGIAGLSKAQLGNLVGPGSANAVLTTVSKVDPIRAYIPLSEQQYLKLMEKNQEDKKDTQQQHFPLELLLANGSKYAHPGKFFFADRQVDVKTGTIQVAVLFPNPGNILRPGQYARVRAIVKIKPGALLVQQRAVAEMQGRKLVAIIKPDDTIEVRPVKVGETVGNLWVIDEGLQPNERVVVEGIQKARPGTKVQPKPFAEPPAAPGR